MEPKSLKGDDCCSLHNPCNLEPHIRYLRKPPLLSDYLRMYKQSSDLAKMKSKLHSVLSLPKGLLYPYELVLHLAVVHFVVYLKHAVTLFHDKVQPIPYRFNTWGQFSVLCQQHDRE